MFIVAELVTLSNNQSWKTFLVFFLSDPVRPVLLKFDHIALRKVVTHSVHNRLLKNNNDTVLEM